MKSALTFLLACILLCYSGAAGDEALEPWYIARGENGLFGYIDRQGQWRIGPQFANGDAVFAGRYQLISTDAGWNEYQGIIDRQGAWALEPEYMIYAMDYLGSVQCS